MRFEQLEKPWQRVFELAVESMREGNLPIGAVITDDSGTILSEGRNNYVVSKRFPNCKVDHAETECIQQLDIDKNPDLKNYIIYTSMEPCPMCMGTIIMSNLKRVRIAARDTWAGASDIFLKNPYAARKSVAVEFADDMLASIQIALQGCMELRYNGPDSAVYKSFIEAYPEGASAAYRLFSEKTAEKLLEDGCTAAELFDLAAQMIETDS